MRPLTPEEIARAPEMATRLWCRLWLTRPLVLFVALAFLFAAMLGDAPLSIYAAAMLGILVVFAVPGTLSLFWMYRKFWRDMGSDLAEGLADVKAGKIYDRFRLGSLIGPKTYVVWADAQEEGLDLHVDRSVFEALRIGDHVLVAFLPRSRLVVDISKVVPK